MKEENQLSVEVAEADETRRMLNRWTLELANLKQYARLAAAMARMETNTVLDEDYILEVMNKFEIGILV